MLRVANGGNQEDIMSRVQMIVELFISNGIEAEIRDGRAWAKTGRVGYVQWYDVTNKTYEFDA